MEVVDEARGDGDDGFILDFPDTSTTPYKPIVAPQKEPSIPQTPPEKSDSDSDSDSDKTEPPSKPSDQ